VRVWVRGGVLLLRNLTARIALYIRVSKQSPRATQCNKQAANAAHIAVLLASLASAQAQLGYTGITQHPEASPVSEVHRQSQHRRRRRRRRPYYCPFCLKLPASSHDGRRRVACGQSGARSPCGYMSGSEGASRAPAALVQPRGPRGPCYLKCHPGAVPQLYEYACQNRPPIPLP
jgi:guanyl-specific ribonuclease Sa